MTLSHSPMSHTPFLGTVDSSAQDIIVVSFGWACVNRTGETVRVNGAIELLQGSTLLCRGSVLGGIKAPGLDIPDQNIGNSAAPPRNRILFFGEQIEIPLGRSRQLGVTIQVGSDLLNGLGLVDVNSIIEGVSSSGAKFDIDSHRSSGVFDVRSLTPGDITVSGSARFTVGLF